MMTAANTIIQQTEKFGARNYHPLQIVITEAKGVWVKDPEGNKYLDMLSAYSAVNQGHCHPKIIDTLKKQADKVTLTSRAFYNDQLGTFYEKVSRLTGKKLLHNGFQKPFMILSLQIMFLIIAGINHEIL